MFPSVAPIPLHWVLRVGNLKKSIDFYQNVVGLRVLRHEEFDSGCEATCNGPYGGAWSKTMIGYGPEHSNFALELTYNYGINGYTFGNDLQYIAIQSPSLLERAKHFGYNISLDNVIIGPDSYNIKVIPQIVGRAEQFVAVGLRVSNLEHAKSYWVDVLGMKEYPMLQHLQPTNNSSRSCLLGYSSDSVFLQLIDFNDGQQVDHALSSGRIAFSCASVPEIFEKVSSVDEVVQTPPLTLPTPGKADVVVTILLDHDKYEICFVEGPAFYDLATPKYDIIDFAERAARGGDGVPLAKVQTNNAITELGAFRELMSSDADKVLIVEFGATWCKNCKRVAPFAHKLFNTLSASSSKSIGFIDIDIDEADDIAAEYEVSSIPRFMAFQHNAILDEYTGSDEGSIEAFFKKHTA